MSSLQHLLDIIIALNTNKKKERLSALENLTDLLNVEKLVKNIHKNSLAKDNTITWDIIFIRVHNTALSLIDENDSKSRQLCDKHIQIIQNVIFQVVQKSVYQKVPLTGCNLIVSSVLAVFETNFRKKTLGSIYLNLFNKYVASQRKRWCELKEEHWIGIKNICKNNFSNPPQGIHNTLFLEILVDVIRLSQKTCQIAYNFLDLFDFIRDILVSYNGSRTNFEILLLRLTNTLCLQLAIEFRFKVCDFMENIFDFVINCHENKKPEKNILVYHFLMISLNIHNPNGLWDEKTSYACDKRKWRSQIREIFFLCHDERKLVLKNPNKEIENDFLNLFVDVSHLVSVCGLENCHEIIESDVSFEQPGPSNKRKCSSDTPTSGSLSFGRAKQIKLDGSFKMLLNDLQSCNTWFWVRFLELLLHKYPLSLKDEYLDFIETLYYLICDKRDVQTVKSALRCLCSLIEVENLIEKDQPSSLIQRLNEIWNKICAELLRNLPTEGYSETHLLLRALTSNSKLRDPGPLVKLYCKGTLQPSLDNFRTLCTICQNCILPDVLVSKNDFKNCGQNVEKVGEQLLNWLFQGKENYPCKDFSKILIALISKRFEEEIENSVVKEDSLIFQNSINDFCKLITRNYMCVAFKNLTFLEDQMSVETNVKLRLETSMKNKLSELLGVRAKSLMEVLNNETLQLDDQLKTLKDCLWFCELLCYLHSHFECVDDCNEDVSFFTEILQSLLYLCSTKSLNLLNVTRLDLTCFSKLYNSNFHSGVQKKIREPNFTNLDFLKAAFDLFAKRDLGAEDSTVNDASDCLTSISRFSQLIKNHQSALHFESLSKPEKLAVIAVEMLCQYVAVPGVAESNRYQAPLAVKIIENLISDEDLNVTSNFHLQLVLRVVYNFTKYDGITVSVLNGCLDLINLIIEKQPSDFEVMITTLQILKDFAGSVQKVGNPETRSKYMEIIERFRCVVVVKKNCGIKAASKFIECLAEISKTDREGNWALLVERNNSPRKAFEEIVSFLRHPYHEVRLTAARQVGLLFVHEKNSKESTLAWQKEMLKCLFQVLTSDSKSFLKENGFVAEYFDYVTSSISLISFASVICLSNYWRKKALFHLIHLAFVKKLKTSEVEDIIKLICRELKITNIVDYVSLNFPYLFYKWTKKGLRIEDFPYKLLNFDSVEDFILNNFQLFVTIYSQLGQLDIFRILSSKLSKPVGAIIKDCHSGLMSFILPNFNENSHSEAIQKARKLKRFIYEEVTSKTFCHWLSDSLDEVIYQMVRNVYDPSYLLSLCEFEGNIKDDKYPVGFAAAQIAEALENLATDEGKSLLGKVAAEAPGMIEKILLLLLGDVEKAVIHEERVFAFLKYIFFVETISQVTNRGSDYRPINTFIVRDVVYTVGTVVRKNKKGALIDMACECLKKLTESYLKEFSAIVGEFLPAITTILTPLAKENNKKALELLGFLACRNYSKLESYIVFLDPFPPDEVFGEINQQIQRTEIHARNLKSTIDHFIKAGSGKNSGCRIEGLKNLRRVLSEEKGELKDMYEDLKLLRGFSEDCKKSLLHQLVCMLVELTSDQNVVIRTEAAKCLGELGPCDLTTLVLRPENNFAASKETGSALNRFFKSSLIALSDLLINEDYNVKRGSSKALHAVLSTKQGREGIRDEGLKNVEYLTPFTSTPCKNLELSIRKEVLLRGLNGSELWRPIDHENWIVSLVDCLLESLSDSGGAIKSFRELIRMNRQFAESIFPATLDLILSLDEKDCNEVINKNVSAFFENYFDRKGNGTNVNRTSVQCMVNVVDYIRIQRNHEGVYQGFDLNLNYLHVAKAALYGSAFFTAIFYAELWFEDKRKEDHLYPDVNSICESFPEEGFALTEILRECHSKIGNSDGIHGCGYMHVLDPSSEIHHYEHLKNWSLSILYHDIRLSQGQVSSELGLLNALDRSGMLYTLRNLIDKNGEVSEAAAIQYKCAAQLLDWSQVDSTWKTKNTFSGQCFEKCYYFALKAFHNEDEATFQNEAGRARRSVLTELAQCSLESSQNLYLPISELQRLKELEEFYSAARGERGRDLLELHRKWEGQDEIKCGEFKLTESILTNRAIMIRDELERTENPEARKCLQSILGEIYHKLTRAARKEKKYETAIRTLSHLNNLTGLPDEMAGKVKVEKARVLWERGDKEIGRFLLSHLLKRNEIRGELKSKSLRIYGDWMARTKSENSREIIEKYYLKSIEESNVSENRLHSFASLAKFADSNYEQLNEYLSSPLFEIKQHLINTQQDLASELRQELGWKQNREKKMAYQIASKQSAIDENEIKNSKAERDSYLNLALKYYLMSLKEGESYNLVVFRVTSLWLSNACNPEVIQQLQKMLHQIPTYKFLCLLPQLVPRMADVCLISDLVEKILRDHPHHTLPLLFALENSYKDLKYNGVKTIISTPRMLAAKSILEKFQTNSKLERLIVEMRQFTEALIELANYTPSEKGKPGFPMELPEELRIKRLAGLTSVPVPSLHIPHNKSCVYDDLVGVCGFEKWYYFVGGVNLPKRVTCIGSDGSGRPLLVKGKDDLRQDAVMQQVFTIMNSLLNQNPETKKRKLVIRTYKVFPLSQRSGVIEWCENTQPLSLYLTGPNGKSGAHKKFYPEDKPATECRAMIMKVFARSHVTNEDKLKVFLEVCRQIRPVFHHFFIENFPAAGVWFERRLAYIHSVATSSMIGYILGIGDRHVNNILIDNSTAEVIHIDLGIAFEQGKTLPTPETVPFRLTRDIVDGMGLSGVEGDFRISCIKTMEVLRENQDAILTLLEVLLYDPLYTWTITPEKAYSIQNHTDTSSATTQKSTPDLETNKMAERALIRLKQKLQGTETGCGWSTNVEGQVNYLLQQARDPNNLCRLFHGWQAFL